MKKRHEEYQESGIFNPGSMNFFVLFFIDFNAYFKTKSEVINPFTYPLFKHYFMQKITIMIFGFKNRGIDKIFQTHTPL